MQPNFYRKEMVLVIIGLFIGAGVLPSISGDIEKDFEVTIKKYNSLTNNFDILDQYQEIFQETSGVLIFSDQKQSQSFKPSMTVLTKVELAVNRGDNTIEPLIVTIRKDTVEGAILRTVTTPPSEIEPKINTWHYFDFQDLNVTPNDVYFIRIESGGSYGMGLTESIENEPDPYVRGSKWGWWDHGGGNFYWREQDYPGLHMDLAFRTYGAGEGTPVVEVEEIQGGFRINAVLKN